MIVNEPGNVRCAKFGSVAPFVAPLYLIGRVSCVFCAWFVLKLDVRNGRFIRAFRDRRGGRVAEGGGLLNRYTV